MRKKFYAFLLFLLVVTSEIVFGKEINRTKVHKTKDKQNQNKEKSNIERIKRSLDDEEDKPFWANRGKKKNQSSNNRHDSDIEKATKIQKRSDYFDTEPFWGTRGRRESASHEVGDSYSEYSNDPSPCNNCYGTIHFDNNDKNFKDRRQDGIEPFWGNRGRRGYNDVDDINDPFWGNRGRRQDNEPFWGTRGRRKASSFWNARARSEDEPFWGTRGRRDDEPFWGNRGRRQDSDPFWGNRGRRLVSEPFWGNRGRREDEPFWGNRGRRKEDKLFGSNQNSKKEDLKESIMNAIALVEHDIDYLSRLRRSDQSSFWSNRGRDSKIKYLFNAPTRNRVTPQHLSRQLNMENKFEPSTVHDSRIFADEPHYIIVERSSRSSAETDDPFYISRGKKYYVNYNLIKAARDRRGALEEIVKTVRNDPYYIARGKKDKDVSMKAQSKLNSTSAEEFVKAKELICSAIDLMNSQHQNGKSKREIDSDRDRRTILKKLAAQLQIDPYYVSRGKKSDDNLNDLGEFLTNIANNCN